MCDTHRVTTNYPVVISHYHYHYIRHIKVWQDCQKCTGSARKFVGSARAQACNRSYVLRARARRLCGGWEVCGLTAAVGLNLKLIFPIARARSRPELSLLYWQTSSVKAGLTSSTKWLLKFRYGKNWEFDALG